MQRGCREGDGHFWPKEAGWGDGSEVPGQQPARRLESLGPGGAAARGRRSQALELDRRWRREEQAHRLATRQGHRILHSGFRKKD